MGTEQSIAGIATHLPFEALPAGKAPSGRLSPRQRMAVIGGLSLWLWAAIGFGAAALAG